MRALDVKPSSLGLSSELFEHLGSELILVEVLGVVNDLSNHFSFYREGSTFGLRWGPWGLGLSFFLELGLADWADRVDDVADILEVISNPLLVFEGLFLFVGFQTQDVLVLVCK